MAWSMLGSLGTGGSGGAVPLAEQFCQTGFTQREVQSHTLRLLGILPQKLLPVQQTCLSAPSFSNLTSLILQNSSGWEGSALVWLLADRSAVTHAEAAWDIATKAVACAADGILCTIMPHRRSL